MEVLGSIGRMDLGRECGDHLLRRRVFFARETLLRRKKNNWGRFINITSAAVKQPADGLLLSNSVRASMRSAAAGLARTARLDNLAKSISTRTNVKLEEVFAGWARKIPTGRIGTPIAGDGGLVP